MKKEGPLESSSKASRSITSSTVKQNIAYIILLFILTAFYAYNKSRTLLS